MNSDIFVYEMFNFSRSCPTLIEQTSESTAFFVMTNFSV
jgi:hypothetical protein